MMPIPSLSSQKGKCKSQFQERIKLSWRLANLLDKILFKKEQ